MSREIKFRAWDPKRKKWLKDFAIDCDAQALTTINHTDLSIEDGEVILMQFTGLKDVNKKEIWEGDIVQWEQSKVVRVLRKGTVVYTSHYFEIYVDEDDWFDLGRSGIKVIGNIYESVELLTATQ